MAANPSSSAAWKICFFWEDSFLIHGTAKCRIALDLELQNDQIISKYYQGSCEETYLILEKNSVGHSDNVLDDNCSAEMSNDVMLHN